METRTIPESEWVEFFDRFSRDHTGWHATIEVLDTQSGPQNVAADLPLLGISFDMQGSRPCAMDISVGDRPDRHVNHAVDMPLYIRQAREPNGDIDFQIEPATGPKTLIHVRAPIH